MVLHARYLHAWEEDTVGRRKYGDFFGNCFGTFSFDFWGGAVVPLRPWGLLWPFLVFLSCGVFADFVSADPLAAPKKFS